MENLVSSIFVSLKIFKLVCKQNIQNDSKRPFRSPVQVCFGFIVFVMSQRRQLNLSELKILNI